MNRLWTGVVGGLMIGIAVDAHAQSMGTLRGYLTGQFGSIAGGDVSSASPTPGVSVSVQESNGWGAELDFGYSADVGSGQQELDIATYMVNVNWIQPAPQLRPYATVGGGVMQIDGCNTPCDRPAKTYDFGLNAGGGLVYVLRDAVGFRGDVRYFWSAGDHPDLQRPSNFGFWRASIGVTFIWAIVP